jgi:hypothetical protein
MASTPAKQRRQADPHRPRRLLGPLQPHRRGRLLGPRQRGDHRLPAPRRDQARPRRDGRVPRLHCSEPSGRLGRALVRAVPRLRRRRVAPGAVGQRARDRQAPDPRGHRHARVLRRGRRQPGGLRALLQRFVLRRLFFCTSTSMASGRRGDLGARTPSPRRRRRAVTATSSPPRRCRAVREIHLFLAGGLPGYFPPIAGRAGFGQVGFNLYDPFNWFDSAYPGKDKARTRRFTRTSARGVAATMSMRRPGTVKPCRFFRRPAGARSRSTTAARPCSASS